MFLMKLARRRLAFFLFALTINSSTLAAQESDEKLKHPQNDLYCDFIFANDASTLELPISNGKYSVSLIVGDEDYLLDNIKIVAEGFSIGPGFDTMAGQFSFFDQFGSSQTPTFFEVEINDGGLTLELSGGRRGPKKRWVLNQMTIRSIPNTTENKETSSAELCYDFGTLRSPIQAGYIGISPEKPGPFTFSKNVTAADRKIIKGVFSDRFSKCELSTSSQKYGERTFHYRLYEPQTQNRQEPPQRSQRDLKYPLVVWLHGYGDGGSNNESQIRWLKPFFFDTGLTDKYAFYIVAAQCPPDDRKWTNEQSTIEPTQTEDMADICKLIIDKTINEFPIDDRRIYLLGISSGGTGVWNVAGKYPDTFAAVMPVASGPANPDILKNIGSVPVWAFHNQRDWKVPPEAVRNSVNTVNWSGGNAYLSEFDGEGHIANPFYRSELEAGDWLFSKRRGDFAWWLPPGEQPSHWTLGSFVELVWPKYRIPLLVAATVCLVWSRSRSKRKKKTDAAP